MCAVLDFYVWCLFSDSSNNLVDQVKARCDILNSKDKNMHLVKYIPKQKIYYCRLNCNTMIMDQLWSESCLAASSVSHGAPHVTSKFGPCSTERLKSSEEPDWESEKSGWVLFARKLNTWDCKICFAMGVCGCCYCRPARRMKEEPEQVSSCQVITQVKEVNT